MEYVYEVDEGAKPLSERTVGRRAAHFIFEYWPVEEAIAAGNVAALAMLIKHGQDPDIAVPTLSIPFWRQFSQNANRVAGAAVAPESRPPRKRVHLVLGDKRQRPLEYN